MTKFYKLFDDLIGSIPESMLFFIRLCALSLWFIVALFVGINSWYKGTYSVYQMRDELPNLKEEVFREKNRANPSKPFISDIDKFAGISRNSTIQSNKIEKERGSLRQDTTEIREPPIERLEVPIDRMDASEIREPSIEEQTFSSSPSPPPSSSPSFRANPSLLLEAEVPSFPDASASGTEASFHSSTKNLNLLPVDE